ncbi:Sodium/calcium exchanger 3 [Bulinus truncatus]|nr:Sodium/calcium exchanger 3 [Bulinus truncatus]
MARLLIDLFTLLLVAHTVAASNDTTHISRNCSSEASPCKEGLILPMWKPQGNLSKGDKIARATVYMAAMIYLFLGVSIIADRFMAAIEVITSKEKDVIIKRKDGTTQVVSVRIWNETVSNLTLMALGSSAPEILLSVIEIIGNNFDAGELGPGTIVGSAAFNLFIIIAICIVVVPKNEVRRIKHLRVFFITATWSIFAYLWLYFILSVSSYGVVDIWEAVLTFIFFPLTVLTAYVADKKLLVYKFLSKKYSPSAKTGVVKSSEGIHDVEMSDGKAISLTEEMVAFGSGSSQQIDYQEFEDHKRDFIEILKELRKKHPNMDSKTLNEMAEYEVLNKGPKSRAFYRIQATRLMTGGGKVINKAKLEKIASMSEENKEDSKVTDHVTRVYFDPDHYTVMENIGSFTVTVTRDGGDMSQVCLVDYYTEDGTATGGEDYVPAVGTLIFHPYEKHKQIELVVIDDDVFEEDEHFYVYLSNPRLQKTSESSSSYSKEVVLAQPAVATVMIIDDDHPGIFHFETSEMTANENIGELLVKVVRSSGARGMVRIPYYSVDGKAKRGLDYELTGDSVVFENDQTEDLRLSVKCLIPAFTGPILAATGLIFAVTCLFFAVTCIILAVDALLNGITAEQVQNGITAEQVQNGITAEQVQNGITAEQVQNGITAEQMMLNLCLRFGKGSKVTCLDVSLMRQTYGQSQDKWTLRFQGCHSTFETSGCIDICDIDVITQDAVCSPRTKCHRIPRRQPQSS